MTENEATQKWCPHARKYHSGGSFNRTDNDAKPGGTHCIGSKCMAWRWVKDPLIAFVANGQPVPDYTGEHGYCGLAGPL
jgi:hypothetical protein